MSPIITISKSKLLSKLKRIDFYNIFLNITLCLLIIATILLIINPSRYISSINAGIELFFYSVFPSLLPFLFLSRLLDGLGAFSKLNRTFKPITTKLYNCPPVASYPLLMTIISGYPIGAKIVGDLHTSGQISTLDAKKIITLSSTSGPIFVIGSVGAKMLNNTTLGSLIFLCHILGCLFTAILFTRKKNINTNKSITQHSTNQNLLNSATTGTISAILTVAVYVSIFYMFIDMAYDLNLLTFVSSLVAKILNIFSINPDLSIGIASGLIEMTRGCKEIASIGNDFYSLVCCSGLISFGGLSIILQSLTLLSGTKIKPLYFVFLKTVQAVITIIIAIIFGLIFLM